MMQRKMFVLFAGLVMLSLLIAPIGGLANAQNLSLPPTPGRPQQYAHAPVLPVPSVNDVMDKHLLQTAVATNPQVNAPATVGASGLSFSYSKTIGTTSEPYLVDNAHLNRPTGLFVDASDSLYVAEQYGSRVQKYSPAGMVTLTLGHVGQPWAHDDFLGNVRDVTVNSVNQHIWVAMSPAIKEFDASGTLIQSLPAVNPWENGVDNEHFGGEIPGITFGAGGYLYVVDQNNQRVQVYDVSGAAPVYITTIGTTGVPQTDNTGFNWPTQVAFDSLNRLYVADGGNFRTQRCTSSAPWTTWVCATFFGETGVTGTDLSHLGGWSDGIEIDTSDVLYISDGQNSRVLKCNLSAVCSVFAGETGVSGADNTHFSYTAGVEVDSAGNVYIADQDNYRIQKFNSAGVYQSTLGVTGVPYLTDDNHLNRPWGIALASDNGLYVLENSGHRLVKMDASGAFQWSVGEAGVYGDDNAHFGFWWGGPEGSPAVDANGRVYVGDTPNNRVQIFNSDGTYHATLGEYGQGNYQFDCPTEIAIHPTNGDIYVLDRCNQRVQVFTSALGYKGTIGTTQQSGSDNLHFNWAWGLTVDASGNVFVADRDNQRIQKCVLTSVAPGFSCSTFLGETGVQGDDFNHFGGPISVKVDEAGRVYVVDEWNGRVQIFDASGAYLTTVGGIGDGLSSPSGLAIDASGSLYVADRESHRIEVFTPGYPGWRQANINGFGERANEGIFSMTTFDNQLYAGTINGVTGGQIWRTSDGKTWSQFSPGLTLDTDAVVASHTFGSYLYIGTSNTNGGEIWRTDGSTWTQVVNGGFGSANNYGINSLAVFSNTFYAATSATDGVMQIYRSASGDNGTWTAVVSDGFGGNSVEQDVTMDVYGGYLYAGINRAGVAELWRTNDGTTWSPVFTDGLAANNTHVSAMAEFGGAFYIGLRNVTRGGEVWQTTNGTTFTRVFDGGLGDSNNLRPYGLEVFNGRLYLVFSNRATGAEVWRTPDGTIWEQVGDAGWGDSNNHLADYFDKGATVFNNSLFIGTLNSANGGEVWQMMNQIYLPLVLR